MNNKDPKIYLQHVKDCIVQIRTYSRDITEQDFYDNDLIQDGVVHRLIIIGEAVKNIPVDIKEMQTNIPWKKIAGFRDILVHEYYDVDLKEVWNTVQTKLGELESAVDLLLKEV